MYRIKAKQGYNIILNDIGIKLRSNAIDWTEIDEELFDNSKDAKKLAALIIKDNGSNKVSKKINEHSDVIEVQPNMFVIKGETATTPKDIFVKKNIDVENVKEIEIDAMVESKEQISLNGNDAPILVAEVQEKENKTVVEKTEEITAEKVEKTKEDIKNITEKDKKNEIKKKNKK